jgi:hypothetical protein
VGIESRAFTHFLNSTCDAVASAISGQGLQKHSRARAGAARLGHKRGFSLSVCVEVRLRLAQPPSRVFFGSLPTFARPARRSPELCHQLPVSLSLDAGERISTDESRVSPSLSLRGIFGGHTSEEADGPRHHPSIMMCIELRIRCSQPPSHWFSSSLLTFAKASLRSRELRD